MKRENSINHYKNLFNEYPQNSLFLKLQKKLTELLNSLNLENKDIILAISWGADSMVVASQILYYFWKNELQQKCCKI